MYIYIYTFGELSKLWSLFGNRPRIRPRIIIGTQKGTIILTVPHIDIHVGPFNGEWNEKDMETT